MFLFVLLVLVLFHVNNWVYWLIPEDLDSCLNYLHKCFLIVFQVSLLYLYRIQGKICLIPNLYIILSIYTYCVHLCDWLVFQKYRRVSFHLVHYRLRSLSLYTTNILSTINIQHFYKTGTDFHFLTLGWHFRELKFDFEILAFKTFWCRLCFELKDRVDDLFLSLFCLILI